ncbi:MAG: ABC transporter substrate-binding protein [Gaiellaceae bacterium]
MGRVLVSLAVAVVTTAVLVHSGGGARGQAGGIFRISFSPASGLDHIDPALSFTAPGWALLDTTCARLMTYPDKPPPASFRLQPEVAASVRAGEDFKSYTFTLRRGLRFSDGSRVRASAFAHAMNRLLAPVARSPGAIHVRDIVGAEDVLAGRRATATGIVARGYTLTVRFTRPAPDFPARTTMPFFCAVPPGLPSRAEGAGAFSAAGPYFVQEYRPGERVLIRRNRYYGGSRDVHVDGFDVDLRGGSPQDMIRRIDRDEVDWGHTLGAIYMDPALGLVAKYGINRSELFVRPGLTLRMLAFNAARPLFRNNPRLRRAINFALDRTALMSTAGGPVASRLTDQYVPPSVPGFRDTEIYPLDRANLVRARELARGNLRSAKAVFYAPDFPLPLQAAQLVKQQLAAIGLDVAIRPIPLHIASAAYFERLAARNEPWDIALILWTPNIPDPHAYINLLLEAQFGDGATVTRFRSRVYRQAMQRAARAPQPRVRARAYAALDAALARDAAPLAALNVVNEVTLVSSRVGCIVLRPTLDLTVACLDE